MITDAEDTNAGQAQAVVMPLSFWVTIAVSWQKIKTVISTPNIITAWVFESPFPEDDGWRGLPDSPGLWRCRIEIVSEFDEPVFIVKESIRMSGTMLDVITAAGDKVDSVSA